MSCLITQQSELLSYLKQCSVIMTTDYGESFESMDHFGGRVCWFENFGTDEGGWTKRDIGRFPGVNLVKGIWYSSAWT